MAILSLLSITKLYKVVASSAMPEDSSSSSSSSSSFSSSSLSHNPNVINMKPNELLKIEYKRRRQQQQQQQKPSVLEIERAIGAGIFRDRDVNSGGEDKTSGVIDSILKNSVGKDEGSVEKSLRETGEWLTRQTDTTSRSAGKQILKFIFVWMIPLWITAFLLVTGLFRLPFPTPFLDDLIS